MISKDFHLLMQKNYKQNPRLKCIFVFIVILAGYPLGQAGMTTSKTNQLRGFNKK